MSSETSYVQAGTRKTIHRVTTTDGVRQVGTERCNLDDAKVAPIVVSDLAGQPLCGWCFPTGEITLAISQAAAEEAG
jgi:hypothetical protein